VVVQAMTRETKKLCLLLITFHIRMISLLEGLTKARLSKTRPGYPCLGLSYYFVSLAGGESCQIAQFADYNKGSFNFPVFLSDVNRGKIVEK
jgi:hypothetical protein